MATKYSTYAEKATIVSGDLLLGSDSESSLASKNFDFDTISETIQHALPISVCMLTPLRGVIDNTVNLCGELRRVADGETGDYATDFNVSNNHIYLYINSITGTGDITITGDSLSESTAVPVIGDTEVITVDSSTSQYYQSDKKFWAVTNIDIPAGITAIDYDIGVVGYNDFGNHDFKITGYRVDAFTQSDLADLEVQIIKIQDDGEKKMSITYLEKIGFDASGGAGDQVIDNLRTSSDDRSYDPPSGVEIVENNQTIVLKQGDFDTYFSSDEHHFESSTKAEGFIIRYIGSPSGGISNVDWANLRMDYKYI